MGDTFGGSSSNSDSTYGSVAGDSGSYATPSLPDSSGDAPAVMGSPYGGASTPSTDSSTNWGGILSSGVGLLGAGASLYRQQQQADLEREKLDRTTMSPEARQVGESTYMANRQMMLAALQNFYARKGWSMPQFSAGGAPVASVSTPRAQADNGGGILDIAEQAASYVPTRASMPAPAQQGQAQTGASAQQQAANKIGALMSTSAKDAYSMRAARQQSAGQGQPQASGADRAAAVGQAVAKGVDLGQKIYNAAFQKTINAGGSDVQASQAGEQAASQAGFTTGQIAGYAQGAMTAVNALRGNGTRGQKAFGAAQGANQIYGAAGGSGAGYIGAGLRGAQVLEGNQGTPEQRATRAQQEVGLGVADMFTYGMATPAEAAARRWKPTSGILSKIDALDQKTNPATKILARSISGKSEDLRTSDMYRERMRDMGIIKVEPGSEHEEWNIYLPDKTGAVTKFDIGRDGGGGRSAHELDEKGFFNPDGSPTLQGRITGRASALADLITGADDKQATKFAGYFANAGLSAAKGDEESGRVAMRSLYQQFGFRNADEAIQGIQELQKAGKIDEERAASQINSIRDTFDTRPLPEEKDVEPSRPKPEENGKGAAPRDMRSILGGQGDAKSAVQLWREKKKKDQEL